MLWLDDEAFGYLPVCSLWVPVPPQSRLYLRPRRRPPARVGPGGRSKTRTLPVVETAHAAESAACARLQVIPSAVDCFQYPSAVNPGRFGARARTQNLDQPRRSGRSRNQVRRHARARA